MASATPVALKAHPLCLQYAELGAVLRGELQTELQQGEDEPEVRTGELRAGGALWWGLLQVVFLRGNLFSTYG